MTAMTRKPLAKILSGALGALVLAGCVETQDVASGAATSAAATSATTLSNPLERSSSRKLLEAMDICLTDFPDLQKVRATLRQSGYTSELRRGNIEYFSAYNRQIIVAVSTSASERLCSFGLNGLRDEQAVLLAGSMFAARSNGTLQTGTPTNPTLIAAFQFIAPNGATVRAGVTRKRAIPGLFSGSVIILREFNG